MNNLARFPISVSAVRHPRAGFESIPRDISKAELLRYFAYSENDLREINLCRGASNCIGFALLLSGARLRGRFPYDFELISRSVLTHIQACLKKLRADGYHVNDEDLRFLSPLSRQHLGLYGRYEFDLKRLEELPPLEQFSY